MSSKLVGPSTSRLFFQISLSFFPRETGKAGKTGNISKIWKFNRGQNIWKASHFNIWKKKGQHGNTKKKCAKKYLEIWTESPSIRTASKVGIVAIPLGEVVAWRRVGRFLPYKYVVDSRSRHIEVDHYPCLQSRYACLSLPSYRGRLFAFIITILFVWCCVP